MSSDEKFVRTVSEMYAEIDFILEHDPHHYRLLNQAWGLVSPGESFSREALPTLASADAERFFMIVRRLVQRDAVANGTYITVVSS